MATGLPRTPRPALVRLVRALATGLLMVALLPAAHAEESDPSVDDLLGGFDEAPANDEVDDLLGGFDDDGGDEGGDAAEGDLDDLLGGFDDGESSGDGTVSEAAVKERWWDFSGNTSVGASYNLIEHDSTLGPPPDSSQGTYYGNLQRLRLRADLQLDLALPWDWKLRAQGYGWYDLAYVIHGKQKYTTEVLDAYEYEFQVNDLWLEGEVFDGLDLKLGRQVVNWGRSDTLRVNDVLNPLNNLEPGLTDIESLRLPVTMAKADYYWRDFTFTALVIPELRYDWDPPPGSDFFPGFNLTDLPPLPPAPVPDEAVFTALYALAGTPGFEDLTVEQIDLLRDRRAVVEQGIAEFQYQSGMALPSYREPQWGATPEFGGAITGIFSGWDASFYVSRTYQNRTSTVVSVPEFGGVLSFASDDDLVWMVGGGANYTLGSWLFKGEMAYLVDLDYTALVPDWERCPVPMTVAELPDFIGSDPEQILTCVPYTARALQIPRLDYMVGVEYYGISNLNVSVEVAHRHLFGYDAALQYLPNYVREDSIELAVRLTQDLMAERLSLTALGVGTFSNQGHMGSILRFSADYDIIDALVLSGGYIYYVGSDFTPFDTWKDNDRLFMKVKYSF